MEIDAFQEAPVDSNLQVQADFAFRSPSLLAGKRFGHNRKYAKSLSTKGDWETTASSRRTPSLIRTINDANLFSDMSRANTVIPGRTVVPMTPEESKACKCSVEPSYFCAGGFVTAPEPSSQTEDINNRMSEVDETPEAVRDAPDLISTSVYSMEGVKEWQRQSPGNSSCREVSCSPDRKPRLSMREYNNDDWDHQEEKQKTNRNDMETFTPVHQQRSRNRPQSSAFYAQQYEWDVLQTENEMEKEESSLKTTSKTDIVTDYDELEIDNDEEDIIIRTESSTPGTQNPRTGNTDFLNPEEETNLFIRNSSLLDLDAESEAEAIGSGRIGDDDDHSVLTSDETIYTTTSLLSQMKKYPTTKSTATTESNSPMPVAKSHPSNKKMSRSAPNTRPQPSNSCREKPQQSNNKRLLSVKGLARILSVTKK